MELLKQYFGITRMSAEREGVVMWVEDTHL